MQKHENISKDSLKIFLWLFVILEIYFLSVSVLAQDSWVAVYPGNPTYNIDMNIVHFRDEKVGWAAGYGTSWKSGTLILHTNDGGINWQEESTDFPYEHAFFINPREGWTFQWKPEYYTHLMDDIELYHSTDGGLSWQLQPGKVTGFANISGLEPAQPFQFKYLTQICFIDSQKGWLTGYVNGEKEKNSAWVAGNIILATNDGGKTWYGQIDVYPTFKWGQGPIEITLKRPMDIDFVSYTNGWILAYDGLLYRTTDGGRTWEKLMYDSHQERRHIDFVDTQNGWSTGLGIWSTQDGGNTWIDISPAPQSVDGYIALCFINADEGWTVGSKNILWEPGKNIYEVSIFHTTDGGRTWQVEWKTEMEGGIAYLGYDEATSAIWAGGTSGLLMKRLVNPPATSVSPKGKLSITWGKIKSETP
jgi:photosystem II stability/assembly factor-like uncharacterized protein